MVIIIIVGSSIRITGIMYFSEYYWKHTYFPFSFDWRLLHTQAGM